jgi:hypothetical protein
MHPLIRSLALFAFSASIHAADTHVSGTWNVNIQSSVQTRSTTMTLTQVGSGIKGFLHGANNTSLPITGMLTGDKISLSYPLTGLRIQNAEGTAGGPTEMTLRYEGKVANDQITAKAHSPLAGDIVLTAKKQ